MSEVALEWITGAAGFRQLADHYRLSHMYESTDSATDATLRDRFFAQFLFNFSMGLGRAVEIVRAQLSTQNIATLTQLVGCCSDQLRLKYAEAPSKEVLFLALYGRKVVGPQLLATLRTDMSKGKCMLLESDPFSVTVIIPPLRLGSMGLSLFEAYNISKLSEMVMLTNHMNPDAFEYFLLYHEIVMRSVRKYICTLNDDVVKSCTFDDATLLELYFGRDAMESDVKCVWRNSELKNERFDFTEKLEICRLNRFPHFKDAEQYVNKVIVTEDINQKGFEYSVILKSKNGVIVSLPEQNKLTMVNTIQEVGEIKKTMRKTEEVLSKLGWTKDNIVLLFRTNREVRQYETTFEDFNAIVLCRESLVEYLGPTVEALFYSSECLSDLKTVTL